MTAGVLPIVRKGDSTMADLKLTFAMTPYDRVLPIISGEVKPDGITLEYMGMPGSFSRVRNFNRRYESSNATNSARSNDTHVLLDHLPRRDARYRATSRRAARRSGAGCAESFQSRLSLGRRAITTLAITQRVPNVGNRTRIRT